MIHSCNLLTTESATTAAILGFCKVTETVVIEVFLATETVIILLRVSIFFDSFFDSSIVPWFALLIASVLSSLVNMDFTPLITIPGNPTTYPHQGEDSLSK